MSSTVEMIEYLEPTNPKARTSLVVPRVGALKGKRIAFLNNGWSCFSKLGVHVERALRGEHGVDSMTTTMIPPSSAPQPGLLERVAAESDAAIVGLAN